MPPNTLCVTRPGKFGNPFVVGGYFKIGTGGSGFSYLQTLDEKYAVGFMKLLTAEGAVEMFRLYRQRYPFKPEDIAELRAADYLACFCPLDRPCHADVLLEIANA